MRRNIKQLFHVLYSVPWWGVLFAGIAGYVIWDLACHALSRASAPSVVSQAADSLAVFWLAFCLGAALFGAVLALFDRVRLAIAARTTSAADHWTGKSV
jgi:hypothetical protein